MSNIQTIIECSRKALAELKNCTQEQVDEMCHALFTTIQDHAEELAIMAVEETRMGHIPSKIIKNTNMGAGIWETMVNKKSMGIIDEDLEKGLIYVAHPKGVIASVVPTTNPTITPLGNAMIAIKGRNTLIVSPHPRAKNTTAKTIEYMNAALEKLGAPKDIILLIEDPSIAATQELMAAADVVVATGGMAMVKAAYSSGKPAFGVGQGNVQTIIDGEYDNLKEAAEHIVMGRSLDNGLVCACNQSCIIPKERAAEMKEELRNAGAAVFDAKKDVDAIRDAIFENGVIRPEVVGQSAFDIAKKAGLDVAEETPILVVTSQGRGSEDPLCGEKLCPVLVFTESESYEDGIAIARANLEYQGAGHSAAVNTNVRSRFEYAALELPVSRVVVNVPGFAAGGEFLNLPATPSLGCGSWGGNSISENLTFKHLLDVSTIAYAPGK